MEPFKSGGEEQAGLSEGLDMPPEQWLIGDWLADSGLDELRRGDDVVKIEPRNMRLLVALAQRPGEVLTVDALLTEVWADLVVSQSSVYQAVSQLRQVLGDVASQPRYIATVPRKGYRLVAVVQPVRVPRAAVPVASSPLPTPAPAPETAPEAAPVASTAPAPLLTQIPSPAPPPAPNPVPEAGLRLRRRGWLMGGGAVALAGAGGLAAWWQLAGRVRPENVRLAVLPFQDTSAHKLEQPLADGLAEQVIGALASHAQVRVLSRATSFQFKTPDALVPLSEQSFVTHALAGELTRSKSRLSLRLSLHGLPGQRLVWHEVLSVDLAELSRLALNVANQALGALGATPVSAPVLAPTPADAYELYLTGLQHQRSGDIEGILKARADFQRAIDADPGFALAYVGQASTWMAEFHYGKGLSLSTMDVRAQPLIDRALQLDPELPLALGAQGSLHSLAGRHDEARRWHEKSLALAPSDATLLYWAGTTETSAGWPARALAFYGRAAQLNPMSHQIQNLTGVAATNAGLYADAEAAYRRSIRLAPKHPNGQWGLGIIAFARGRLDEAAQGYRKALLINPNRPYLWEQLAWIYLDLGLVDEAGKAFAQFEAQSGKPVWAQTSAARRWLRAEDRPALVKAMAALPPRITERDAVIDQALLHLLLGQKELALKTLDSVIGLVLADPRPLYNSWDAFLGQHPWLDVAAIYLAAEQRDKAEPFIEQASSFVEGYASQGNVWHAIGYHRARIAAMRGKPEAALAALEAAYELGWRRGWWLAHDPALQSLRELPRFKALLALIEQSNQAQRSKLLAA